MQWQSLRQPFSEDWLSVSERPSYLRLKGMESPNSRFRHSLIGRRQQAFHCEAETAVEFEPETYQQMAGLIYYYNSQNYYYLRIGYDEEGGTNLGIVANDHGIYFEHTDPHVSIPSGQRVYLRLILEECNLQFYYSLDGTDWSMRHIWVTVILPIGALPGLSSDCARMI
ncbi:hypothetical protein [Paenibacillus solisilvae]|uniref:beta-xylosidase family glycoside hydrolase n=1 Tax=Paenibacillus solisilvae TaxID=2486751 RepID=UPI003A8FCC84